MQVQRILIAQKTIDSIDTYLSMLLSHFDTPIELIGKFESSLIERDPLAYKQYLEM